MRKVLSGLLILSIVAIPAIAQTQDRRVSAYDSVCDSFEDHTPSKELQDLVEKLWKRSDTTMDESELDDSEAFWENYTTDPTPEQLAADRKETDQVWSTPVPDDLSVIEVIAGGVPGEWVRTPGVDPDRRLLYLHGGGWRAGSAAGYREFTSRLSRSCGCSVLAIDYRLAPEHPFPAAVEDGFAALNWMRANGPMGTSLATATFVAGDSAGGNWALSLLLMARDAGVSPDAAVTFSAATDHAATGESFITRAELDPVLNVVC